MTTQNEQNDLTKENNSSNQAPSPSHTVQKTNKEKPAAHKKIKFNPKTVGVGVLVVALSITGVFFFKNRNKQSTYAQGIAYLEELQNRDEAAISAKISERDRQERLQEIAEGIGSDDSRLWALFRDSVILGDSRAVGFKEYGYLPENVCLARIGDSILALPQVTQAAAASKPEVIYLSYGANDLVMDIGADRGEDGYGLVYEEYIKQILALTPNSKIVVNGIIAPRAGTMTNYTENGRLEAINAQIQRMCERNNWIYVDNTVLDNNGNAPIYEPDGLHFPASFYPQWGRHMITAYYNAINTVPTP